MQVLELFTVHYFGHEINVNASYSTGEIAFINNIINNLCTMYLHVVLGAAASNVGAQSYCLVATGFWVSVSATLYMNFFYRIEILAESRLKKLRDEEDETVVTGKKFSQKLKRQ